MRLNKAILCRDLKFVQGSKVNSRSCLKFLSRRGVPKGELVGLKIASLHHQEQHRNSKQRKQRGSNGDKVQSCDLWLSVTSKLVQLEEEPQKGGSVCRKIDEINSPQLLEQYSGSETIWSCQGY